MRALRLIITNNNIDIICHIHFLGIAGYFRFPFSLSLSLSTCQLLHLTDKESSRRLKNITNKQFK